MYTECGLQEIFYLLAIHGNVVKEGDGSECNIMYLASHLYH